MMKGRSTLKPLVNQVYASFLSFTRVKMTHQQRPAQACDPDSFSTGPFSAETKSAV
jgi:hypothetical protein